MNSEETSNQQFTILESLNRFRRYEQLCDVTLLVGDEALPAHRNVLSAGSIYFFENLAAERRGNHEENFTVEEVLPDTMKTILNFLYTGVVPITDENVEALLHAGSMMQISGLLEEIEMYMSETLSDQNCLMFYRFSCNYHISDKIKIESFECILENFENVYLQKDFRELGFDTIKEILKCDKLKVKEENTVFEAVIKWIGLCFNKRKKYFPKLFHAVRLSFLPIQYVIKTVREYPLIREFEATRCSLEEILVLHAEKNQQSIIRTEKPRLSYRPEPMKVLVIHPDSQVQQSYDKQRGVWNQLVLNGWEKNLVSGDCALATEYKTAVFCGGKRNDVVSNSVVQFKESNWNLVASMNEPRCGAAATLYGNKLFVFGGEKIAIDRNQCYDNKDQNPRSCNDFCDTFEVFDENMWTIKGKLVSHCSYAAAETIMDEIYLIGGYIANTQGGKVYSSNVRCKIPSSATFIYNVKNGTWRRGPCLKSARAEFGSVVWNSAIYALGGYNFDGYSLYNVEYLQISSGNNTWTVVATYARYYLPQLRACCVDNQIFVTFANSSVLLSYDPQSQQWTEECRNLLSDAGLIIPF